METVIKQKNWSDISIEHYDYNDGYVSIFHYELDEIRIEKSKAREVALAICPELESELKEAVELIETVNRWLNEGYNDFGEVEMDFINNFLTKHKSKE